MENGNTYVASPKRSISPWSVMTIVDEATFLEAGRRAIFRVFWVGSEAANSARLRLLVDRTRRRVVAEIGASAKASAVIQTYKL